MEVEYRLALSSLGRERSRLEETVKGLQEDIQDERERHAERWETEAFSEYTVSHMCWYTLLLLYGSMIVASISSADSRHSFLLHAVDCFGPCCDSLGCIGKSVGCRRSYNNALLQ